MLFENVIQNSLLKDELDKDGHVENQAEILGHAHLYVHSNTLFGYGLDLLFNSTAPAKAEVL